MIIKIYISDYDGQIVFWNIYPQNLYLYIGSAAPYNCPSRLGWVKEVNSASGVNSSAQHYAMNVFLFTDSYPTTWGKYPKVTMIKNPGRIMLMADVENYNSAGVDLGGQKFYQQHKGYAASSNYFYSYSLATRHEGSRITGGSNILFIDGHVNFQKRRNVDNSYKTSSDMWQIW